MPTLFYDGTWPGGSTSAGTVGDTASVGAAGAWVQAGAAKWHRDGSSHLVCDADFSPMLLLRPLTEACLDQVVEIIFTYVSAQHNNQPWYACLRKPDVTSDQTYYLIKFVSKDSGSYCGGEDWLAGVKQNPFTFMQNSGSFGVTDGHVIRIKATATGSAPTTLNVQIYDDTTSTLLFDYGGYSDGESVLQGSSTLGVYSDFFVAGGGGANVFQVDRVKLSGTAPPPATSYTLTGPAAGLVNQASSVFTVQPDGAFTGNVTITPSSGFGLSPVVKTFGGSSAGQTFTLTPTATGTVTLTPTNDGGLTDPSPLDYDVADAPANTGHVVFLGDSLTYGENASSGQGTTGGTVYPAVALTILGTDTWDGDNEGVSGNTLVQMLARVDDVAADLSGSVPNYIPVMGGTNDIGIDSQDGPGAYSRWVDLMTALREQCAGAYLIAITIPAAGHPSYPGDFNDLREVFNALVRANWRTYADGFADVGLDSRIGVSGTEADTTYFNGTDHTHLTDDGYAIVAEYVAAAIRAARFEDAAPTGGVVVVSGF